MNLAIIGGGPRALFALEELSAAAAPLGHNLSMHVVVFEPHSPGSGWVYRSEQPACWRLNAPAHMVRTGLGTADEYLGVSDPFPPRREVGTFLRASWDHAVAHLPENLSVEVRPQKVSSVERKNGHWLLEGERFEEVLIATGHQHAWDGRVAKAVHPYFDGLEGVEAGQRVHVRGAALTFIDVCLALTEGRGGQFLGEGIGEYVSSGNEPECIVPHSRTGRFMEVKPSPHSALAQREIPGQQRFEQAIAEVRDAAELKAILAEAAATLVDDPQGVRAVLEGEDFSGDAAAELERSVLVALGEAEPHAAWAVGHVWRGLYQALIQRVSYGRRIEGFEELARTMERVAFGPPPVTATRLASLLRAQVVHAPVVDGSDDQGARFDVDAVIAPAGVLPSSLAQQCVDRGFVSLDASTSTLALGQAGQSLTHPTLAIVGRDAEGTVLGHDTLNRDLHPELPRWAQAVVARAFDRRMHATVPLEARLEPWMLALLRDPVRCEYIVDTFSSPANVVYPQVLPRNAEELLRAGRERGVEVQVYFARKANKALAFVDAARDHGHGIDVASERELTQVLARGVPGERIILSAAIKPDRLLRLAIEHGVCISTDTVAEARNVEKLAQGRSARIAPRIAPDPEVLPATRFGELASVWVRELERGFAEHVHIAGVHLHLHGYAEADRRKALAFAFQVVDAAGGQPEFIDIGGGIPMSYLDHQEQWRDFQQRLQTPDFTWKRDPLSNHYPFYQRPVRGQWLAQLLDATVEGYGRTAEALRHRGLRLHAEPGRSLLDGGGVILARVAFVKTRSDGLPLVGLEMNRTQCRTTSDDILLDPILVPSAEGSEAEATRAANAGLEAFLVGAYCIEDEVIVRRAMRFPQGVAPGDIVAIPNTAGYFMHILESASHQIPLAHNVVFDASTHEVRLDAIDERDGA